MTRRHNHHVSFARASIHYGVTSHNCSDSRTVTAPAWSSLTGIAGRAYIIRGSDGAILHTFEGDENNAAFGFSIASIGDLTGDGFPEIAVGAPMAGLHNEGRVYIYNGLLGFPIEQIDGTVPGGHFGGSIAGAGDINGDGFAAPNKRSVKQDLAVFTMIMERRRFV